MENWISATPTQGSRNGSVNVTVGEYKTSMRTGTITISGRGITKTVSITQNELNLTSLENPNGLPNEKPNIPLNITNGTSITFVFRNYSPSNTPHLNIILKFNGWENLNSPSIGWKIKNEGDENISGLASIIGMTFATSGGMINLQKRNDIPQNSGIKYNVAATVNNGTYTINFSIIVKFLNS